MPSEPEKTAPATLLEALLAFHAEMPTLQKDATNPHFRNKYVSLEAITQAVTPVLTKCGLVWTTLPCREESGEPALRYELAHVASGEKLEGIMPLILAKNDMQGLGSSYSYGRRYAISAVLGLSAEDDDGNKASQPARNGRERVSAPPAQATEDTASAKQRGLIFGKAGEKNLPPVTLATIVNTAGEGEVKDFESQSAAEDWLRRALDRLPARLVDPVLAGIEKAEAEV